LAEEMRRMNQELAKNSGTQEWVPLFYFFSFWAILSKSS
jgi:hypothetical protein